MRRLKGRDTVNEYNIMIVDDEPDISELLEKALKIEGFQKIVKIGTGNEAVAACKRERPDVVILDVMLPDLDGYEVCRQIRHLREKLEDDPANPQYIGQTDLQTIFLCGWRMRRVRFRLRKLLSK